jgi:hypothetical protein
MAGYDRPSLFCSAVLASLQRDYKEALRRNDVKAIVLTGIYNEPLVKASNPSAVFLMFYAMCCRSQREVFSRI